MLAVGPRVLPNHIYKKFLLKYGSVSENDFLCCLLEIFKRKVYVINMMDYSKYITIDPSKRGGKPCIRGMRIAVSDVLEYLASGMTEKEILADFPELTDKDIHACLAFAADRERRLATSPV